jgi:hypothetical protein
LTVSRELKLAAGGPRGDGVNANLSRAHLQDWAWSFPSSLLVEQAEYRYSGGYIVTPDGVVGVYTQLGGERQKPYTELAFSHRRRTYNASWERAFSARYLKTLASRFASKVVADHG